MLKTCVFEYDVTSLDGNHISKKNLRGTLKSILLSINATMDLYYCFLESPDDCLINIKQNENIN